MRQSEWVVGGTIIWSSMPTHEGHTPERALDGDEVSGWSHLISHTHCWLVLVRAQTTFFWAGTTPRRGDAITLWFPTPLPAHTLARLEVLTGKPKPKRDENEDAQQYEQESYEYSDMLEKAEVQVSADGTYFHSQGITVTQPTRSGGTIVAELTQADDPMAREGAEADEGDRTNGSDRNRGGYESIRAVRLLVARDQRAWIAVREIRLCAQGGGD